GLVSPAGPRLRPRACAMPRHEATPAPLPRCGRDAGVVTESPAPSADAGSSSDQPRPLATSGPGALVVGAGEPAATVGATGPLLPLDPGSDGSGAVEPEVEDPVLSTRLSPARPSSAAPESARPAATSPSEPVSVVVLEPGTVISPPPVVSPSPVEPVVSSPPVSISPSVSPPPRLPMSSSPV